MIKSTLPLLLLAAMLSLALAEEPEPLGQDCFNCRCVRNIDYQVGLSFSLSLSVQDSPGCHFYFQCGSDGRNYQNECLFRCAQEKCPTKTRGVTVKRGMCEDQGDQ